MGFYSVSPLTPGGWTTLLDERGLPHNLRRLPITIAAGGQERSVDTRCLPMLPALAYLLSEPNGGEPSPSVKAWRLVARLTERVIESGGERPDLDRFAAAFPPLAHAALSEHGELADTVTAEAAVEQFVRAAMRSLAAAVRDPRLLTAADSYHDQIDLAVLQPALRSVAPDLGAVAPIVNLRQSLEPLELVLQLPPEPSGSWPLELSPPDFDRIKRAASILPLLAGVRDGRAELTLAQVAELRTAAPALEFSGAQVRLPEELGRQEDLELDAAGLSFAPGPLSLGGVVEYDLRAALGGVQISEDEFRALAAATQPLVRIGGEWRLLGDRALRRARQLAQLALHGAGIPALTALGATLAGRAELRGFEVEIDRASAGELEALARRLRDPELRAPVDPEPEFNGVLRPYQHSGLGWLVGMRRLGLGALLADDMGLGKTVQLIAYLLDRTDGVDTPALIVCPASVLGNWQRELHRFAPGLTSHIHHGPDRTRAIEGLTDVDVVLTSYSLLPRDRRLLAETEWRVVVLDEAQQVKNPLTRGAQAARALQAHHRIALTGTPIENRLDELWSILHFLNPGLLDTRNAYRRRYATPIEKQRDPEAAERLRRITGPFILRRHKSDPAVLPDLPPRQESNEYCTLTVEQAALYQATIDAMLGEVRGAAGIERRGHVLALLTRLKQVCNHPAQALGKPGAMGGRSGKLDRLTEMLAEARGRGRQRAGVHPVRGDGADAVRAPHPRARCAAPVPGRLHPDRGARAGGGRLPGHRRRTSRAGDVAESRRSRSQPDQRQPRVSLRPLVEPGGRGPGLRPGASDRADQGGAGAPDDLRGHHRGAHRRADRGQARAWPRASSTAASRAPSASCPTRSWPIWSNCANDGAGRHAATPGGAGEPNRRRQADGPHPLVPIGRAGRPRRSRDGGGRAPAGRVRPAAPR